MAAPFIQRSNGGRMKRHLDSIMAGVAVGLAAAAGAALYFKVDPMQVAAGLAVAGVVVIIGFIAMARR